MRHFTDAKLTQNFSRRREVRERTWNTQARGGEKYKKANY
jgi:hypothetical protein